MTGTMWLALRWCGTPAASSAARSCATRCCCASRSRRLVFRCRMLASAPAAIAGRQGGGEDEAGREAADEVAQRGRRRDVAADHAEPLGQGAFDHRQPVGEPFLLCHAAAARAVEAHGMHLVEIGHGAMPLRYVADLGDRRDVAVHRVDRFERDQLRNVRRQAGQPPVEVGRVVMREHDLLRPAVADALDHGGVVAGVGQHDAAGQAAGQGAQRRPIRHVAGVEQQRGFRVVQVGQFLFQQHVVVVGACDVAGAARAGAAAIERLVHRRQHGRVLAHAEIVVGAPHRDVGPLAFAHVSSMGKASGAPLQIGEDAVIAVAAKPIELPAKEMVVVHGTLDSLSCGPRRSVSGRPASPDAVCPNSGRPRPTLQLRDHCLGRLVGGARGCCARRPAPPRRIVAVYFRPVTHSG